MDTDNDGIVSYEELKTGIAKFGSHLAESEVQMLIEAVSISKNPSPVRIDQISVFPWKNLQVVNKPNVNRNGDGIRNM